MPTYKPYSRLAKIEEQKSKRTAFLYIVLSILFVAFMAVFGVKLVSRLAGVLADVNTSDNIDRSDSIPPAPPNISYIPEAIKEDNLLVSGYAEPGATVAVFLNDEKKEVVSDNSGNFTLSVKLNKGSNSIYAKAIDLAGNESTTTSTYTINYDNEPPKVEVIKPKEGEQFFGNKQRQLTVEGTTESDAKVTVNDRVVILDSAGKFRFPVNLGEGENSFNIKSTDQAGNQTEMTIKVTYAP